MNTDKHRWRFLVLLLLFAAHPCAARDQVQEQTSRPSERVERLVRLRQWVAEHPADAAARVELGNALDDSGDSAGAIAQYREAVRIDPQHAAAYRNLALAHLRQGQWVAAEAPARDALKIQPDYVPARCDLAVALGSQKKTEEASREWQRALAQDRGAVARYWGFERRPEEAAEFARTPPAPAAQLLIGMSLRSAGERSRAIREIEKALELEWNFALAHLALAELHAESGKPKESGEALQRATRLHPALVERRKGQEQEPPDEPQKKRREEARPLLAACKEMAPNLVDALRRFGANDPRAHKARELLKETAIRMKAYLELLAEDAEGFLLLGDALRELGEPRAAWAYEQAIRAAQGPPAGRPNDSGPAVAGRAWMGLGLLQSKVGRDATAMEMYSQGLLLAPGDPEVLNAAARLCATSEDARVRNPLKAVEWARKAVEATKEKNAAHLSTLAEAYFAHGQIAAAVRAISVAIALEPGEAAYRAQWERMEKARTGR